MFYYPHRPNEWSMQRDWLKANPEYIDMNKQDYTSLVTEVKVLEKVLGRPAKENELATILGRHPFVAKAYCNKTILVGFDAYPTVREAYRKAVKAWRAACDQALFDYYIKPHGIVCSFERWKNLLEEIIDPDGDSDSYDKDEWSDSYLERREQAAKSVWIMIGSLNLVQKENA